MTEDSAHTRHLLDDAYAFERALDFTAAVSRARAAALSLGRFGPTTTVDAAEVAIATTRFDAGEAAWRREVQARSERFRAREVAEADQWPVDVVRKLPRVLPDAKRAADAG